MACRATCGVCLLTLAILITWRPALAAVTVQISQSGNDVVLDARGTLDYTDLSIQGNGALIPGFGSDPETGFVLGGFQQALISVKFRGDGAELTPPNNDPFIRNIQFWPVAALRHRMSDLQSPLWSPSTPSMPSSGASTISVRESGLLVPQVHVYWPGISPMPAMVRLA